MSIESTLERIATALEKLAFVHANIPVIADPIAAAEPPAPRRGPGRPPKAAAPAPEAAPVVDPAPAPATVVPAGTSAATKEQTQNALVALIKANKRDAVVKILGEHGATSVSALAPEHYAAVYAKAIAATPAA